MTPPAIGALTSHGHSENATGAQAPDYDVLAVECHNEVSEELIEESSRSIIISMLKQASKGMDLHKIAFPTFVLEPRSMLERLTDFMSHPQLIADTPSKNDPLARFLDVVRYFLSGWHVRPKGVKKPYNSVLGEFFRCRWQDEYGKPSTAFFIAEQVSHHPPISAYLYADPEHHIVATGNFMPKSRFLGNSVMSLMNGKSFLYFTNHPGEEYVFTNPNVYARGLLFGTMFMEIGDIATITCEKTDLCAEIEFKTKGFFGGSCNDVSGCIKCKSTNAVLYTLSGKWTETISITPSKNFATHLSSKNSTPVSMASVQTGLSLDFSSSETQVLFDAFNSPVAAKLVPVVAHQEKMESRRLWAGLTNALQMRDYDRAATEKAIVEDEQRMGAKMREQERIEWTPQFFKWCNHHLLWCIFDRPALIAPSPALHQKLVELRAQHFFGA